MRLLPINIAAFLVLGLWTCTKVCGRAPGRPVIAATHAFPHSPQEYRFNFKGYSTKINDDAVDENGNHLLVGEFRTEEKLPVQRDTMLNRILNLNKTAYDESRGFLIATDKDYRILKMDGCFIGKEVLYDAGKKQFTVGAMFLDYLLMGDRWFGAWQPVIVQTNIELEWKSAFIPKPYSCLLQHIEPEGDEVLVFARSDRNLPQEKGREVAEIMRVSPAKFHSDSARPWIKALDILASSETPHQDLGDLQFSNISKVNDAYYFATSNLNQWEIGMHHHLYLYRHDKLTELTDFPDYLQRLHNQSTWVILNGFKAHSPESFTFLSHVATQKRMQWINAEANFRITASKEIALHDYGDFHRMLVRTNGNVVLAVVNPQGTWSYQCFNSKMELLQEVDSKVPENFIPILLQETPDHSLECIFHVRSGAVKDCVVQVIRLGE